MAKVQGNPQFDGLSPESSRAANPKKRAYSRIKFAPQPSAFIYNVSGESFRREMGGTGNFLIKACLPGLPYSEPTEIEHPFVEEYASDNNKIMGQYFDADEIAESLVRGGIGGENNNLYDQGVFWTHNNPPKEEEVAKARTRYTDYCKTLVTVADKKYNLGNEKDITNEERRAAAFLKINRMWNKAVVPMKECPNCQEYVAIGAATHSCGAVLDWDKAVKLGLKTPEERDRASGKNAEPASK
jgi:hypothetical protein